MDTFDEIHLAVKNNNISYAEIAENIGISREHLSRQLSKKELSKKNTNKIPKMAIHRTDFYCHHNLF